MFKWLIQIDFNIHNIIFEISLWILQVNFYTLCKKYNIKIVLKTRLQKGKIVILKLLKCRYTFHEEKNEHPNFKYFDFLN